MKRRVRFAEDGMLAIAPKAWGQEFIIFGGDATPAPPFEMHGSVAVVGISGPLMSREGWFDNYAAIRERAKAAFASEARTVCLHVDSPGGDAAGCFELSRDLRAMARVAKKPLLAFTDGIAASAAYAIACAADRIGATSSSEIGSIGVFQMLADCTAQDAAYGLKFAVVTSGARKLDTNPHVPLNDGAIAATQTRVDALAALFFDLVAEQRGIAAAAVAKLDGALFLGARAVVAGLADEVTTWAAFLASASGSSTTASTATAEDKMNTDEIKKALQALADGDDKDEADKAKKMLAAFGDEESDDDKAKKAKAEEDQKKEEEAKAAEEEKKKDEEAKARAQASGGAPDVVALTRTVHELQAERAAEKEQKARAELLAQRPDFSAEVQATFLAKDKEGKYTTPLASLQDAVKTWPKGPARAPRAAAAAASVTGTRGKTQTSNDDGAFGVGVEDEVEDHIDKKMGLKNAQAGVVNKGSVLELGFMTPAEAAKCAEEYAQKGSVQ